MIKLISIMAAFLRPMYCDRTPSGNRISAPAKSGTDNMNPVCAGLSASASVMNGAMAPFRTQIPRQKSKYRNDAKSVGQ